MPINPHPLTAGAASSLSPRTLAKPSCARSVAGDSADGSTLGDTTSLCTRRTSPSSAPTAARSSRGAITWRSTRGLTAARPSSWRVLALLQQASDLDWVHNERELVRHSLCRYRRYIYITFSSSSFRDGVIFILYLMVARAFVASRFLRLIKLVSALDHILVVFADGGKVGTLHDCVKWMDVGWVDRQTGG